MIKKMFKKYQCSAIYLLGQELDAKRVVEVHGKSIDHEKLCQNICSVAPKVSIFLIIHCDNFIWGKNIETILEF